ncbi:ABC transporter permease [Elioraea rosea]|uniref:ABC transporter permease n=1 Tax=Elioraea rosea TaxID=2492390 RepID=UPI0011824CCB|nr:iron ABC transporter permease [Elioraea rosea]
MRRAALWLAALALAGVVLPPWYLVQDRLADIDWSGGWLTEPDHAPAVSQALLFGRWWLWPVLATAAAAAASLLLPARRSLARALAACGTLGLLALIIQGYAIGLGGWRFAVLEAVFGPLGDRQFGIGTGATLAALAFLWMATTGLAGLGFFRGDPFTAGAVGTVALAVILFTFLPIASLLSDAFRTSEGTYTLGALFGRLGDDRTWGLACLAGAPRCGVAWNTLMLALMTAGGTTALGLAFALLVTRGGIRFPRALRTLTILPIITPSFVIGLGLILIFGRSGIVNQLLYGAFGIEGGRWIYGLQGVWLAQMFAFTPTVFLVLIGVVEGVSPTMEEAAQTLRANRWHTFATVSLPLMRPGIANAFLVAFVESIADFGNPIVLGGNFGVLSTEIFFAVVGAQADAGRAATLALVLLVFALGAFWAQARITGSRSYVSIAGKGDGGVHPPLPAWVRRLCLGVALPWAGLTILLYAMALTGGFVETWGRDYTPTLRHLVRAFDLEWSARGLIWSGVAWNSVWTTVKLAAVAAPLTAALGIIAAWLFTRQSFVGRRALEFATMLSFAVPGTVIGVAYIYAFNVPPLELTGTGIIIVLCFMFRNLSVGLRSGMAAMSQIDRSLDEASFTLGGGGLDALRRVILPLLRPAIIAALAYSFVRAVTTVSAVIFLVSAEYELATVFIINRVINGDYGVAITTSTALIVTMGAVLALIQVVVGSRRIRRRAPALAAGARA